MDRITRLREAMDQQGVDLVVLGPSAHMEWLAGVRPHADERPHLLCVGPAQAAFLTPALEANAMAGKTDLPLETWADDDGPKEALARVLKTVGGGQSLVLDETMRADFAALVMDGLPQATRQFTATTVGALRAQKDADEIEALRRSAAVADRAMQAGWAALRPGMTELELAAAVRDSFKDQGADPLFAIAASGPNGASPHHLTDETQIGAGQPVVMDIGARIGGYPSDITRMVSLGPPPDGYAEVHAVVEAAVQAAMAAARPGVMAQEVDHAARGVISDAGFGDFFTHRTGHGLGIDVHEPPYLTASSQQVLRPGMVFSIEPGIYLPGRFGIRLEEIVVLTDAGPERLSSLPRDLRVL